MSYSKNQLHLKWSNFPFGPLKKSDILLYPEMQIEKIGFTFLAGCHREIACATNECVGIMHVTMCLGVGDVRAYVCPKIQLAHIETHAHIHAYVERKTFERNSRNGEIRKRIWNTEKDLLVSHLMYGKVTTHIRTKYVQHTITFQNIVEFNIQRDEMFCTQAAVVIIVDCFCCLSNAISSR